MPDRRYSVVIATHRRPSLVLECVESVMRQTRPADEVLVVVDGGEDDTAELLRVSYPAIRILNQKNFGKAIAVNRGVAAAAGDWVCLLDDDDLWHEDKLRVVDEYLDAHPDCQAVNHPLWYFRPASYQRDSAFGFAIDFVADNLDECLAAVRDGGASTNDWSYLDIQGNSYSALLQRNAGAYSATVVRRDVYQAAGGHVPGLASAEDWLLFLSIARLTEWHTIPRQLAFSRQHGPQSTSKIENTLSILAAYNIVWYGGQSLPGLQGEEARRMALRAFGPIYREMTQSFLWAAVKNNRRELIWPIFALAKPLLPRRADRAYMMLPPKFSKIGRRRRIRVRP